MEIDPFIFRLSIFILSIFIGYYVRIQQCTTYKINICSATLRGLLSNVGELIIFIYFKGYMFKTGFKDKKNII